MSSSPSTQPIFPWSSPTAGTSAQGGYVFRGGRVADGVFSGTPLALHRELFGLRRGDEREPHHRNANKRDNRRSNLVVCVNSSDHMRRFHGAAA